LKRRQGRHFANSYFRPRRLASDFPKDVVVVKRLPNVSQQHGENVSLWRRLTAINTLSKSTGRRDREQNSEQKE
jgi:hypothetical protein